MTDKEIVKVSTSFRKGVLGKRKPLKMCFAVSGPLSAYLNACHCPNALTEGEVRLQGHNEGVVIEHFWITLPDGKILDPTASQFNGMGTDDMPEVYYGVKPGWYHEL